MSVNLLRDRHSEFYSDSFYSLFDMEFAEHSFAKKDLSEVDVGIVFPIQENGFIVGRGYYQLSKHQKHKTSSFHDPVLVDEVLFWLLTDNKGVYLDCTLGGGGHAEAILQRLAPEGRLLGMDQDEEAIQESEQRLSRWQDQLVLHHGNFKEIGEFLDQQNIKQVDGILFDLGVSSHQIDTDYRGFSFMKEGPLDMRMNRQQKFAAFHVINSYSELELRQMIWKYGEERRAAAIAREIVRARAKEQINSTQKLAEIVQKVAHPRFRNKTLARVYQSVRIETNAEIENLRLGLEEAVSHLKPGKRISVISYHSIEDRLVKQFFRENEKKCVCPPEFPKCVCNREGRLKLITRRPITPTTQEIYTNPRGRSAKLRVAERI